MSLDGNSPARSALAAQAGLTDGLLRLRMDYLSCGIGDPQREGEFSGGGMGVLSGSAMGSSLRFHFNMFLLGGLG